MLIRGNTWIICLAAVAFVLAGCGVATIPDEEVVGLVGTSTAGAGGDTLALGVFGAGGTAPTKSYTVSSIIDWSPWWKLTYDYTIDYLAAGGDSVDPSIDDTWVEMTLDGSAALIVALVNFAADYTLNVSFDAAGFNDSPNDGRIVLDGTSMLTGSTNWTNPHNGATASYSMDLTKTWTGVNMDDPSEGSWINAGYPSAGTVRLEGSIERHRDGPSGTRSGSWYGTILITFDGDEIVPVSVNGREYLWDLSTGEVTPAP